MKSIKDRGPFQTETIGHALRIIDAKGSDILVVGDTRDPRNQEVAAIILAALNGNLQIEAA